MPDGGIRVSEPASGPIVDTNEVDFGSGNIRDRQRVSLAGLSPTDDVETATTTPSATARGLVTRDPQLDVALSVLLSALTANGTVSLSAATLTALENTIVSGEVSLSPATLSALETINAIVSGTVALDATTLSALETVTALGPLTNTELRASAVPVSGPLTDTQLRAASVEISDVFTGGEILADQAGANGVLIFDFTSPVHMVFCLASGTSGTARLDPFGGTPSATLGIPCDFGVPVPVPVQTSGVKVYAPTGLTITVWGMRYA